MFFYSEPSENSMDIQEKMIKSEVRMIKVVFPRNTNHYDSLFGGKAMQMMDEAAFVSATRFSRKRVVTISSSRIDFKKMIPANTIVEVVARVVRVGNTSLQVDATIYKEELYSEAGNREQAVSGRFTFVAVDKNRRPISVI